MAMGRPGGYGGGVGGLLDQIRGRGAAAPKPADGTTPPPADGTAPPPEAKPKPPDPKSTVEDLLKIFGKKPAPKPEEKK